MCYVYQYGSRHAEYLFKELFNEYAITQEKTLHQYLIDIGYDCIFDCGKKKIRDNKGN